MPRKGVVVPDGARLRGWKKPTLAEQIRRRNFIKKLVIEERISNREEIRRRLKSDLGLNVSRPTVDNDFVVIGQSPLSVREAQGFTLDLLATYRCRIGEVELLIGNSKSSKERAMWMKMQSTLMKDMGVVAGDLASRGGAEGSVVRAQDSAGRDGGVGVRGRAVVVFGEPRVVDKSEIVKDEKKDVEDGEKKEEKDSVES